MPRNSEVIRQFTILRTLQAARLGASIHQLATELGVSTRTIRRDLDALSKAGFPLYNGDSSVEGHTLWRLDGKALQGIDTGFDIGELCAPLPEPQSHRAAGQILDDLEAARTQCAPRLDSDRRPQVLYDVRAEPRLPLEH